MLHSGLYLQSALVMWLLKPFMPFLEQSWGFLSDLLRELRSQQGCLQHVQYAVCTEFRHSTAWFHAAPHALILLSWHFSLWDCQVSTPATGPWESPFVQNPGNNHWKIRLLRINKIISQKRFPSSWFKKIGFGNLLLSVTGPMYLHRA